MNFYREEKISNKRLKDKFKLLEFYYNNPKSILHKYDELLGNYAQLSTFQVEGLDNMRNLILENLTSELERDFISQEIKFEKYSDNRMINIICKGYQIGYLHLNSKKLEFKTPYSNEKDILSEIHNNRVEILNLEASRDMFKIDLKTKRGMLKNCTSIKEVLYVLFKYNPKDEEWGNKYLYIKFDNRIKKLNRTIEILNKDRNYVITMTRILEKNIEILIKYFKNYGYGMKGE